jgi:hypothetical protein
VRTPEEIPSEERLFRKLRAEWLNGEAVLPEAVDLQGTSCDRAKYRNWEELVSEDWPSVAFTRGVDLPRNLRPASAPADSPLWEFFSVDRPETHNEAHCEIRPRRAGRTQTDADSALKKRPPVVREELKFAMARQFRVLREEPDR